MSQSIIEVEGLSKGYRLGEINLRSLHRAWKKRIKNWIQGAKEEEELFWAIKDLSFKVNPGEVVGVIGSNGAGKSTLLKILSRITAPTEGRAVLRGKLASLLEVGTGFHHELTGRENIFLSGTFLGLKRKEIEAKYEEIVEFSQIGEFIETPVKRYSSGMFVRLAFSVAAFLEADIMIVDEVLAVGDAAFQRKCLGKMEDVAQSGRTILFVSHNMGAVKELTTRGIYLKKGRLVFDGPIDEAANQYLGAATGNEGHATSHDLKLVERSGESGKRWMFTGIQSVGQPFLVGYNKPLRFELEYESKEKVDEIQIGFHIANVFGTRLTTCRSIDSGVKLTCAKGEKGKLSMVIEKPFLPPGLYMVQLGAMSGFDENGLDYIHDALRFEVNHESCPDYYTATHKDQGVRMPSVWSVDR